MAIVLLDTDILSEVVKRKDSDVVRRAAAYLAQYQRFEFSAITRYEITRGLKQKGANQQLKNFAGFCQRSLVHPITDAVLDLAGDLWAEARRSGHACSDPDLIIAATALIVQRGLVTGNRKHFDWIPGLSIEDWRTNKP
jgi:tRNA(fMet)-specific endonuclease VapC